MEGLSILRSTVAFENLETKPKMKGEIQIAIKITHKKACPSEWYELFICSINVNIIRAITKRITNDRTQDECDFFSSLLLLSTSKLFLATRYLSISSFDTQKSDCLGLCPIWGILSIIESFIFHLKSTIMNAGQIIQTIKS